MPGDLEGTTTLSHLVTLTPEPQKALELRELPCDDCGQPRLLELETGTVSCETSWCSAAGILAPLWRLLDSAGIDHNPAGLHRPIHQLMPIPWITPVTGDPAGALRPHWRMIHRGRLAAAQQQWRCQHCGLPADPTNAVVFVDQDGHCSTSAPLHPDCATVSAARCPHLSKTDAIPVVIARGQERRSGEIAPEIGLTQDWWLPSNLY